MSAVDADREMGARLARILFCCRPVGEVGRCMLRPGHKPSCLPMPPRVMLCVHCSGKGNSDSRGRGWNCTKCHGTCLAG